MQPLTDTVTSLAHEVGDTVATLAHEVASKAQDAAQAAGERGKALSHVATERGKDWGKQAVDVGRHSLQARGVIAKAPSHNGRNLILLVVLAALGFVAWKKLSGRRSSRTGDSSMPQGDRPADTSHVRVA